MAPTIQELLKETVERDASDLHITSYVPPRVRVHGSLVSLDYPPLSPAETKTLVYSLLTDKQKRHFEEKLELDFSFGLQSLGRFRGNAFMQKGSVAAAFRRLLPTEFSFTQLGIPQRLAQLCFFIVTIEDPIEYFFTPKKAIVNQRELNVDTLSFSNALRSVLREDPDVVFVGEMRDLETVEATLRVAETGHLTFSTLHTNSASETISRIIDIFPTQYQRLRKLFPGSLIFSPPNIRRKSELPCPLFWKQSLLKPFFHELTVRVAC